MSALRSRRNPRANARAFWQFSLALYGQAPVAAACLELQDRHGLDVNLLLFCCWRAIEGMTLEPADLARADRQVRRWRKRVIEPLRRLRRALKQDPMGLPDRAVERFRRQIAVRELEAERMALASLAERAPIGRRAGTLSAEPLAAVNLRSYLAHAGIGLGQSERRQLARLARACNSHG